MTFGSLTLKLEYLRPCIFCASSTTHLSVLPADPCWAWGNSVSKLSATLDWGKMALLNLRYGEISIASIRLSIIFHSEAKAGILRPTINEKGGRLL